MAGGDVIRDVAEYLIIAFIGFALVLEVVLHKVEHWVMDRHPHVQTILRNLYRELMILGLVSFGFIMYLFTNTPTKDAQMTFEVAHVFVFLFAIFHSLVVATAIFISLNLSNRWKMFERMDLVKYLEHKEKYRKLTERRTSKSNAAWRYVGWWITSPGRLFTYNKLHEIMAFHDIRWQFIYYRNLQPEFRFSKFLRKIKMATFIELVEINPLNWIFLIVVIGFDLIRLKTAGKNADFDSIFFICSSTVNILAVAFLANKIQRVYWKLTKNPATYYDTVDPHAFRAELQIAEEETRIRRESMGAELDEPAGRPRFSISRQSRDRGSRTSRTSHEGGHHNPIIHTMALKPGDHGHGHGHGHGRVSHDHPHALDINKRRGERPGLAPANSSVKPARYNPGSDEPAARQGGKAANALLAHARRRHEEDPTVDRMSLDMQAVIPKSELDLRADPVASIDGFWDEDMNQHKVRHMSTERRKLRIEALRRLRERKARNAAIVETAQDLQAAQQSTPSKRYPAWLVKVFPRLGRVPGAAEKLFWFGSHRFYLFMMETLLFFCNVNFAASTAKVIFWYKEMSEYRKQVEGDVKGAAKFLLEETVRAAAKAKKVQKPPEESLPLLWVALVMGLVALIFVLLNVARIMRKYIFVLNNANLLPEDMTITTIQTVNLKDMMNAETMHDGTGERLAIYDSETDADGEGEDASDYRRLRKNMSTFLEDEQKKAVLPISPLIPSTPDARF